jgi:hypothetical protein
MTVGLLGGGVIGGGWAARFLLNGHDVVMYDPDPEASRKVGEVLANARRAFAQLTPVTLPTEGTLRIVSTVEEAADGVDRRCSPRPAALPVPMWCSDHPHRACCPPSCSATWCIPSASWSAIRSTRST